LGDFLFMRFNFESNEISVRGNVVSFPGGSRVKRAGGSMAGDVRLMVLCPSRDENGGKCWKATTEDLLKVKFWRSSFKFPLITPFSSECKV
jgi:hypothetical protein